jgi:hypothetical protein
MVTLTKSRLLLIYITVSATLMVAISLLQYYKYNLFGTNLLLGWDSPRYVWTAKEIMANGPLYMTHSVNYPHLYIQLLAILGYLTGNVTVIERVLPLAFSILLIFANAKITLKITKNIHIAGLAALLTGLSLNTLRLFADLNRNLMALSLSFTSFLLIADFLDQNPINKKSLLSKTYLSIIAIFFIIAGTQLETFLVLALTSILIGIISRNWKKLTALTLIPAIPTAMLLAMFPQLPLRYINQIGLFTRELYLDEILPWIGGSWILFGFLIAGATYISYKAIKQKNTLASAIFSWTAVITLLFILTLQRTIPLSAEYAVRALLILPIPVLLASTVFASANLLKDVFFEIGVSSPTKGHALRIGLKQVTLIITVSILMISSTATVYQHYDEFMTPYIPKTGYEKILAASEFLNENGFSKPIVIVYGEHASWFSGLYSSYLGAEIGSHYYYKGDLNGLLRISTDGSQYYQKAAFACPILLITPYLYDKEIPYYLTRYHIGQGIYVIPPGSLISYEIDYGPAVTVTSDDGIREVRSEYLYADQDDPSLIVLRVTARGHTSYTFENYPQNWAFLKLEQGGALSYPEKDPRRLNGTNAIEGNDPAESTQDWSTSQAGTISIDTSPAKEGNASLKVEGFTDSWGNLGIRYNPQGTWDLSHQFSLAVWAKANEKTTFSVALTDSAGNTRTFWDIQPDNASATTQWKRFTVNLNNYTSQPKDFDLTKVDSVDFYVYSNPGRKMSLQIDDPIIDDALPTEQTVYKARVSDKDLIVAYFAVKIN